MKFVFLTALRVSPALWITWRQHISTLFEEKRQIEGFSCHDGERDEVVIATEDTQTLSLDHFGPVAAKLKAQDLFHTDLPVTAQGHSAHLVVLKTGELCRVDIVDMDRDNLITQHSAIVTNIRKELRSVAAKMVPFCPTGVSVDALVLHKHHATHTLIPYDPEDPDQRQVAALFFAREGLDFEEQSKKHGPYTPGWSFSALAGTREDEIGLFCGVAMRLQSVWFQQRGQRNFCIEQTALLAKQETVETEITTSHEVMRRLFDFTLWDHQLREFSANLKPWLKAAFEALYGFWDMAEENAYIEKTLKQSHDLLASGYQSRIMIQERQQSRLLFVIAALGLLGMMGSLMSIWTALTWGNLVVKDFWASSSGTPILIGLIIFNFVVLVFVLFRFVKTQFK